MEQSLSWGHTDDNKTRKAWARAALSKQQSIGMIALPFLSVGDKMDLGIHLLLNKHGEQEVVAVDIGSPAASAGIGVGDVILSIDGGAIRGLSDDEVRELTNRYEDTKLELKIQPKGSMSPQDRLVYFSKKHDHGHPDIFEDTGAFLMNGLSKVELAVQHEFSNMAVLTNNAAEGEIPSERALTSEPRNGDATRNMMGAQGAPHTPSELRAGDAEWPLSRGHTDDAKSRKERETRNDDATRNMMHTDTGKESHWLRASERGNARITVSKPLPARALPPRDSSGELGKRENRVADGALVGVGCKLMHLSDGTISLHEVKIGGGAHEAGVPSGARLLAVDGRDVHDMPIGQIRELCKGPVGSVTYLKLVPPEALRDADVDDHNDGTLRCETFRVRRTANFMNDENASTSLVPASSMQRQALPARDSDKGALRLITANASVTRKRDGKGDVTASQQTTTNNMSATPRNLVDQILERNSFARQYAETVLDPDDPAPGRRVTWNGEEKNGARFWLSDSLALYYKTRRANRPESASTSLFTRSAPDKMHVQAVPQSPGGSLSSSYYTHDFWCQCGCNRETLRARLSELEKSVKDLDFPRHGRSGELSDDEDAEVVLRSHSLSSQNPMPIETIRF